MCRCSNGHPNQCMIGTPTMCNQYVSIPGSQKHVGCPVVNHCSMNATRFCRSTIHEESGFNDGYAALDHAAGTVLFKMAVDMASNSADITTSPCMACCRSVNDLDTTASSVLYLNTAGNCLLSCLLRFERHEVALFC